MSGEDRNIDDFLKRSLSSPPPQMDAGLNRILVHLRSDPDAVVTPPIKFEADTGAGWRWLQVAAAFLVVASVGVAIVWRQVDEALFRVVEGDVYQGDAPSPLRGFGGTRTVRSNGGAGAVLALVDGSRVEIRPRTKLSFERADDGVRIRLIRGGIIVTAAKQRDGHLYVQTKDVIVSVVGTVFLVNAEEAGSRVAVIEGEVRVQQGATEKKLLPGEQVATNVSLDARPVREAIAWSRNAEALLKLLQQSTVVPPALTPQSPAAPRDSFEVASIRLRASVAPGGRGGPGPDGQEPKCYGSVQVDPRRLSLTNMMLYRVITLAYAKSCYEYERMDLLSGGPRWVTADRYDIEATLPQGTPSYTREQFDPWTWSKPDTSEAARLRAMLQRMLADRFKLAVKREIREVPGYLLGVAAGGHKLTPWKEGELVTQGAVTGGPNQNGEWRSIVRGNKLSVSNLAGQLTIVTGRPVIDRSGITGDFNYSIDFTPVSELNRPPGPVVSGPSLFTALEEALGLRLEAARIPVESLVIEHVERPTGN